MSNIAPYFFSIYVVFLLKHKRENLMRNLIKDLKIKRDLKRFKEFKKTFEFNLKELEEKKNGSLFCDGVCIRDGKDGEWIGESETFVNVGYKFHGALPKALSNLFQYEFYFKGFKLQSIESVFQGFKIKNKRAQRYLFNYHGLNSNNIKIACDYNWRIERKVYFQGKPIDRNSKEYEDFIDELYISAIQNPLYRNVLKNVGEKYILHALGEKSRDETVFSREEFEYELNALKAFVQANY